MYQGGSLCVNGWWSIASVAAQGTGEQQFVTTIPSGGGDAVGGDRYRTGAGVHDDVVAVFDGAIKNLTKEKTGGKVSIKFKHALAKVAINIKDVVDQASPDSSVDPDAGGAKQTKVVVESLKLIGSDLSTDGKLNLYTGNWSDFTSPAATEFVVTPLPASIYSGSTAPTAYPEIAGVQESGLTNTIDIMLVPATSSKITGVKIVYYVITKDEKLKAGASIVKNTITKDLATENRISLTKGTQHNLNILLGLTSVDLTATVDNWDTSAGTTNVDLPKNVTTPAEP